MKTCTIDDINAAIKSETILTIGRKTTLVLLTLQNGFEVVGTSACVDPENYNQEVGAKFARQRALDKVWELEGYKLQGSTTNVL